MNHKVETALIACQRGVNCWQKGSDLWSCSCTISKCSLELPNSTRQSRMSACMPSSAGTQSTLTPTASMTTEERRGWTFLVIHISTHMCQSVAGIWDLAGGRCAPVGAERRRQTLE
jgi:hypothetical protein